MFSLLIPSFSVAFSVSTTPHSTEPFSLPGLIPTLFEASWWSARCSMRFSSSSFTSPRVLFTSLVESACRATSHGDARHASVLQADRVHRCLQGGGRVHEDDRSRRHQRSASGSREQGPISGMIAPCPRTTCRVLQAPTRTASESRPFSQSFFVLSSLGFACPPGVELLSHLIFKSTASHDECWGEACLWAEHPRRLPTGRASLLLLSLLRLAPAPSPFLEPMNLPHAPVYLLMFNIC